MILARCRGRGQRATGGVGKLFFAFAAKREYAGGCGVRGW